jgi:hypothetical protein
MVYEVIDDKIEQDGMLLNVIMYNEEKKTLRIGTEANTLKRLCYLTKKLDFLGVKQIVL